MSDPEIRALVERLKVARLLLPKYRHSDVPEGFPLSGLTQMATDAAAALTALMAERDEARAAFSQASKESAESILLVASASRRAAFARAREIAERARYAPSTGDLEYDRGFALAGHIIASAIEAEMQSKEQKP